MAHHQGFLPDYGYFSDLVVLVSKISALEEEVGGIRSALVNIENQKERFLQRLPAALDELVVARKALHESIVCNHEKQCKAHEERLAEENARLKADAELRDIAEQEAKRKEEEESRITVSLLEALNNPPERTEEDLIRSIEEARPSTPPITQPQSPATSLAPSPPPVAKPKMSLKEALALAVARN
ncbi:MAG TPA: hypothetical protein VFC02_09790 [Anaerolineales bacterium]|nr:hypothetical protein [Anaerolineales bacterium]